MQKSRLLYQNIAIKNIRSVLDQVPSRHPRAEAMDFKTGPDRQKNTALEQEIGLNSFVKSVLTYNLTYNCFLINGIN